MLDATRLVLVSMVPLVLMVTSKANPVFLTGLACGLLLPLTLKLLLRLIKAKNGTSSAKLYNLQHAMLNLEVPPKTMWMNMGYWRDTQDFPTACEALLLKLLRHANLQPLTPRSTRQPMTERVVLDLGFGCGDSAFSLLAARHDIVSSKSSPFFDRYIGVTVDEIQYQLAKSRLATEVKGDEVHLFLEDGARPLHWPPKLRELFESSSNDSVDRWVFALDTMYHFRPSRDAVFEYAAAKKASFAAFDLFLAPNITFFNRLLLYIVSLGLSAPYSNFKTFEAYKKDLVRSGFVESTILIEDITADVFPGLASFLTRRDIELQKVGIDSFSRFRIAQKIFAWFGRGNIIRAGIIVAKT